MKKLWIVAAIVAAVLVCSCPLHAQPIPRVTDHNLRDMALALGGDMLVTELALGSGRGREANWIMKRRDIRLSVNTAAAIVAAVAIDRADRGGHHNRARWAKRAFTALRVAAMAQGTWVIVRGRP